MAIQTRESFELKAGKAGNKSYFFIQADVGSAKYIYGDYTCNHHSTCKHWFNIDINPKLVAIVANKNVYLVNESVLCISLWTGHEVALPQNVFFIDDVVAKENERIQSVIFPEFYNSLEKVKFTEDDDLVEARNRARGVQLSSLTLGDNTVLEPMMNRQDIADALCGFLNLKDEALRRLNKKKKWWTYVKSLNYTTQTLIEANAAVEPFELHIADGMKKVSAKMVTVEFERDGKRGTAKISYERLIRKLVDKELFSYYDFETEKQGKALFEAMGAEMHYRYLTCGDISRITYGRGELYVRNPEGKEKEILQNPE